MTAQRLVSGRSRTQVGPALRLAFVLVVGAVIATPLVLLIVNSFNVARPGQGAQYGLDNWSAAFSNGDTIEALWNSFSLSITRVVISLPIAAVIAWLIARTDLPGTKWIELACWVGVFLPVLPRVFGWILLFSEDFGLVNTWLMDTFGLDSAPFNIYSFWGIIWVHLTSSIIYIEVVLLIPAFRNLGAALEEAARVAGATTTRTLLRITAPMVSPALLGIGILAFVRSLEAFEVELILGTPVGLDVYATRIYNLIQQGSPDYGQATALGSLFLVILVVLALLYQWYLRRPNRFASVTGRGFTGRRLLLGRWRWPIAISIFGFLAIALFLPLVLLVLGSFMTRYGYFDLPKTYTTAHWERVLGDSVLIDSLQNSLIVATFSALIAVVLYSTIAFIVMRGESGWYRAGDLLMWIPWAIPGLLLGLGILWMLLGTSIGQVLYGTLGGLVFAIVLKESPLATMLFKSGIQQLGPELEESARVAGASWATTFRRVVMPLITPTAMTVGVYVFLSAMDNISAVVLLYTGETRPLSILMLEYSFTSAFESSAVVGLIITAVVLVVVIGARAVGVKLTRDRE